jgi:hypothetical protein
MNIRAVGLVFVLAVPAPEEVDGLAMVCSGQSGRAQDGLTVAVLVAGLGGGVVGVGIDS